MPYPIMAEPPIAESIPVPPESPNLWQQLWGLGKAGVGYVTGPLRPWLQGRMPLGALHETDPRMYRFLESQAEGIPSLGIAPSPYRASEIGHLARLAQNPDYVGPTEGDLFRAKVWENMKWPVSTLTGGLGAAAGSVVPVGGTAAGGLAGRAAGWGLMDLAASYSNPELADRPMLRDIIGLALTGKPGKVAGKLVAKPFQKPLQNLLSSIPAVEKAATAAEEAAGAISPERLHRMARLGFPSSAFRDALKDLPPMAETVPLARDIGSGSAVLDATGVAKVPAMAGTAALGTLGLLGALGLQGCGSKDKPCPVKQEPRTAEEAVEMLLGEKGTRKADIEAYTARVWKVRAVGSRWEIYDEKTGKVLEAEGRFTSKKAAQQRLDELNAAR